MIPKTEPAENIQKSTPPQSVDAIVRDLRILEKSFISSRESGYNELKIVQTKVKTLEFENSAVKSELEDMKSKIRLLEGQNSKLKSDLEASDYYKNLYYNQYLENGREFPGATITINKLKQENAFLKRNRARRGFKEPKSEKLNAAGDSGSYNPDVTNFGDVVDNAPECTRSKLSGDDETSNDESHKKMDDQIPSGQQKRKLRSESESENLPKSKKSRSAPIMLKYYTE